MGYTEVNDTRWYVDIIKMISKFFGFFEANGNILPVADTNSTAILLELQGKTEPNDVQNTQLRIMKDGVSTPVYLDTTPSNAPGHVPIPCVITDVNGSAVVNITAGDINVKIVHDGTDPSSVRIGDGTTLVGVTTTNELKVSNNNINPLQNFNIARVDNTLDTKYYGFLDKDGNWYILNEVTSTGIFLYYYSSSTTSFTGASGWSNRALITYVEFNSAF